MDATIETKKVTPGDFEQIYPLLCEFDNPKITKRLWRNLFSDYWNFQKEFIGYKLVIGNRIVGFVAYILSERWLNGRNEKFLVLSSWIVKKEFRSFSLELLYPILELNNHTLLSFTPTPGAHAIETKLFDMKVLDTHEVIIPCLITSPAVFQKKVTLSLHPRQFIHHLTEEEKKYCEHHSKFRCNHLFVQFQQGHLYLITKQKYIRHLRFHKIYYVNRPDLFLEHFSCLRFHLPRVLKAFGLIIDSRFLKQKKIPFSYRKEFFMPMLYRSERLTPDKIDYLYSEFFLLEE
jgi:hypothetical protein